MVPVYYDIEGSGGENPEIVQIGAVRGNRTFSQYVTPLRGIDFGASKYANGLNFMNGQLCKDGCVVPSIPLRDALVKFYDFLKSLGVKCILVAHGGDTFDHPLLVKSLVKENLKASFDQIVVGYADSYKILSSRGLSHNLGMETLAEKYLGERVTHDALSDATQLQRIMPHCGVTDSVIQSNYNRY